MGVVSQNNCFTFYLRHILCYLWDKTIYDFRGAKQCTFSLAQDAYLWVVVADCNGASEGLETMRPRLLFSRRNLAPSGSAARARYLRDGTLRDQKCCIYELFLSKRSVTTLDSRVFRAV